MVPNDLYQSVTKLNLSMLVAISQAAHADVVDTMLRYRISKDVAEHLSKCDTAKLLELSQSPEFLFTVNEAAILAAIKDAQEQTGYESMHLAICGGKKGGSNACTDLSKN